MASINWMKMTNERAGSLTVHMETEARISHNHSNEDIDKEKTSQNYCIGTNSYRNAMASMYNRTKAVDAIIPPIRRRKDRVTCCMLEYPCPKEIERAGKADVFFREFHKLIETYFGKENVHGSFIHKDEIHTYVDGKTKEEKESLMHAHTLVSAYTPEKGINGNAFETRPRLIEFNKLANEMCVKRFGIEYNTHEKARKQSVEEMKIESRIAKLEKTFETLNESILSLENQISSKKQELEAAGDMISLLENIAKNADVSINPEGVEESTRGFLKKETVMIVPKDIWETALATATIKQGIIKASGEIKALSDKISKGMSEKIQNEQKEQIRTMKSEISKLKKTVSEYEKKETLIKSALDNLSSDDAERLSNILENNKYSLNIKR